MRQGGLRILSPNGDLHVTDIGVTGDPAEVGEVDVVLFMVKNVDVESAAEAIKPMLGPETFVVTCQTVSRLGNAWALLSGRNALCPVWRARRAR